MSFSTLIAIGDLKKQLLELLVRIGFVNICQAVADVELTTLLE
jgi:hypothetical protein